MPASLSDDPADRAARLRQVRVELGLSQELLAHRLGVSFATVNRWETGRTKMSERAAAALEALLDSVVPTPHGHTGSDFVGRRRELEELRELLEESRAVGLVGPGGCGKTRLARQLVAELEPGPPRLVSFGAVRDLKQVRSALAAELGIRDQPDAPARDFLAAGFDDTSQLVIFDAVEHVRPAITDIVKELLDAVPGLRIVLTSRSFLDSGAVRSYAVPPLRYQAEGEGAEENDAAALFVARARDRLPGFVLDPSTMKVVNELCRRLGGLPLAIELIAGWITTLSVDEILDRRVSLLRGRSVEPDVLRTVLEASYELLDPDERTLLPALSVFLGAFTVDDAATVTGLPDESLVHGIRALVDAAWLQVLRDGPQNRFVLLDPVREYAGDLLESSGTELAERHARHFATLARDSEDGLASADAMLWRARMTAAWPDVAASLAWAQHSDEVTLGLFAGAGLWRWWLTTGRLVEGREWLAQFLALAPRGATMPRGKALAAAAVLAAENGDYATAVTLGTEAIAIFESVADREAAAFAGTVVGSACRYLGDLAAARTHFENAMKLRRALGDRRGVSVGLNNLALLAIDDGDLSRARELFEESLLLKRQLGEPRAVAIGLANLADVLIRGRQFARAEVVVDEAVRLAGELGDRQLIGTLRCNQGELDAERGDFAAAAACYADAVDAQRAGGHLHDVVVAQIGLARAQNGLGRLAEAIATLREAEAVASGIANAAHLGQVRAALAEFGQLSTAAPPPGVTPREAEILGYLARGLMNKEIAAELHLSVSTVERHLATTYRKLGLRGRVEAARFAVANGLTPPPR